MKRIHFTADLHEQIHIISTRALPDINDEYRQHDGLTIPGPQPDALRRDKEAQPGRFVC